MSEPASQKTVSEKKSKKKRSGSGKKEKETDSKQRTKEITHALTAQKPLKPDGTDQTFKLKDSLYQTPEPVSKKAQGSIKLAKNMGLS